LGVSLGCVGAERQVVFQGKDAALSQARHMLEAWQVTPHEASAHGIAIKQDGRRRSGMELLAFKDVDFTRLIAIWPELGSVPAAIVAQLEIEAHYASYLSRQQADIEAYRRDESLELPKNLDYEQIKGFSNEVREKLKRHGPATLGAAARIPGVTPAAVTILLAHVRRNRRSAVA